MNKELIIRSLDIEIERLQQVRALLSDTGSGSPGVARRRRRGSRMSAEARKRISDAQKKRWAKARAGRKKK